MAKWGHKIPEVLVPDDDICIQVTIPNHKDYIALFIGAVRMLEMQHIYERDETMEGAKTTASQFRDRTITPMIQAIADGYPCSENSTECYEYPAYSGFIHYFPDNPYTEEDPPPGYLMPAWWRWGNLELGLPDFLEDFINHAIEDFTGYKRNDAICWISSLLSFNWAAWLDSGYFYPAIEIEVTGKGTIELALLSFPLGSRAIVEVDEKSNILDIITGGLADSAAIVVDTARDVLSVPPEGEPEIRIKLDIEDEGDHTIYIQFSPVIDPELSEDLLGFGGGLRSVQLCNGLRPRDVPASEPPPPLEGVSELKPEFQFTIDCGLEYRLKDQDDNIVQDWTAVPGWTENAAACFGGLDGVDGTDGADGINGEDGTDGNGNTDVEAPTVFAPDMTGTPYMSGMCRAAYYIADKLIEYITDTWEDFGTLTLEEIFLNIIGIGGFRLDAFKELYNLYISYSSGDVPGDALAARDRIAELIFCAETDQEKMLENFGSDTELSAGVRDSVYGAINSWTQAKINQLAFVGANAIDAAEDCSEFCAFDLVFDFRGDYTAVGDEEVIRGDTWQIYDSAEFISGVGYSSTDGSGEIALTLPRDCRISDMEITLRKHEACSQMRTDTTWRGLSGTDSEDRSPTATVTVDTEFTQSWNVHDAELTEMLVRFSNNVCLGSGDRREYISSIRLVGTGAKPR